MSKKLASMQIQKILVTMETPIASHEAVSAEIEKKLTVANQIIL
jgi:hypothetical protein